MAVINAIMGNKPAGLCATPAEQVRRAVASISIGVFAQSTIELRACADTTNPPGYWDRWVLCRYKNWFGYTSTKILYFERASEDEFDTRDAYHAAVSLQKNFRAALRL